MKNFKIISSAGWFAGYWGTIFCLGGLLMAVTPWFLDISVGYCLVLTCIGSVVSLIGSYEAKARQFGFQAPFANDPLGWRAAKKATRIPSPLKRKRTSRVDARRDTRHDPKIHLQSANSMIVRMTVSMRPFLMVEHEGFRYLGVIQNGFQIGALARTPDGRYVQVNGAFVQSLNLHKVQRALMFAEKHHARYAIPEHRPKPEQVAPVVRVRRRRRVPAEALQG